MEKSYLGLFIPTAQSNILNDIKSKFGMTKTDYIVGLLEKNLLKDFEKMQKILDKKKAAGLI